MYVPNIHQPRGILTSAPFNALVILRLYSEEKRKVKIHKKPLHQNHKNASLKSLMKTGSLSNINFNSTVTKMQRMVNRAELMTV